MKQFLPFKFLIVAAVLCLSQSAQAYANACTALFAETKPGIIIFPSKLPILSRIQDPNWINKKLFGEGELENLLKADYEKDHSDFLSDLLYESTKLLNFEFYKVDSRLAKIEGADLYLRLLIDDIRIHRENKNVTRRYIVQINYALAHFMSMAYSGPQASGPAHVRFSLERTKIDGKFNIDAIKKIIEQHKNHGILNLKGPFDYKMTVVLPLFVDLSIQDFIRLGIKVSPMGMNFVNEGFYHKDPNRRNDPGLPFDSSDFARHDIIHWSTFLFHFKMLNYVERERLLKISEFFRLDKEPTTEEEILANAFYFYHWRENGVMKTLIQIFYGEKVSQKEEHREEFILYMYKELSLSDRNFDIKIEMPYEMYKEKLHRGLEDKIKRFREKENLTPAQSAN